MFGNLLSARELKPKNLNKELISLITSKLSNFNSRNQSNRKNGKTNQIINQNISKEKFKKSKKKIIENINLDNNVKENKNNILLKAEKKMIKNLKKYNITEDKYNKKIITDIIYDERKHIVSVFKNNLLWDETSDFLNRFYFKFESRNRLPKINHYYEKYTLFAPVYFSLEEVIKIMIKNVKRKKKYLEIIEENEDINFNNNNDNKDFIRIINKSEISETLSLNTYVNKNSLTNTFSTFHLENKNTSKDLGQILNKFMNDSSLSFYDEHIISKDLKNNSYDKFINNFQSSKSLFKLNNYEIEKNNKKRKEDYFEKKTNEINKTKLPKTGKILEIKKLNLQNINNISLPSKTINEKKYNKLSNSGRQQIANFYTIRNESSNFKKKINLKPNNNCSNNLLFTQKIISSTSRETNLKKTNNTIKIKEKNNSIESLLKISHNKKSNSSRIKNNNLTQNKEIKQKRKNNLVIQTNSIKNSKTNNSRNKSNSIIKKSKKKNLTNIITTPINFITNNTISSSIFNINLNLNLEHILTNPNKKNKKQSNLNSVLKNKSKSKKKIKNNINNLDALSNVFKAKNFNKKKIIESKRKDEKILYDLNSLENNLQISINKHLSNNNNISNITNSTNNRSLNININCINNISEKKLSRNERKSSSILSNLLTGNTNKGKHLVISLNDNKNSQPKQKKIKSNNNIYLIDSLFHETSVDLRKLKKKFNCQMNKKYSLTSREKDIPYQLIYKMLRNKNSK